MWTDGLGVMRRNGDHKGGWRRGVVPESDGDRGDRPGVCKSPGTGEPWESRSQGARGGGRTYSGLWGWMCRGGVGGFWGLSGNEG